ncbi:MAG: hypothetical protein RL140_633 [Actinomycetota bacterium]|jgi:hypothetical protein
MNREAGSVLPLGIAAIVGTLVIGMVFLEMAGVQYQTIRNKQVSDVLSLEVAGQLLADGVAPVVGLDYAPTVKKLIFSSAETLSITPSAVSVISQDGKTLETVVCTKWASVTGLTLGNFGDVCARSKARAVT